MLPLCLAVFPACSDNDGSRSGESVANPDAARHALNRLRSIEAEETDEVLNVAPVVARDPKGGFLVVDTQESQLRRYGDDGRLLWHTGRKGNGPGEFVFPTVVGRLPGGQVVAGQRSGRLTFFDSAGGSLVRTVETRVTQLEGLVVLGDSALLLSGVGERGLNGPRLHVWNLRRDTVGASFFAPFAASPNRAAAVFGGWTKAAVRGDTVAAVFAVSDTVYLFTLDGRQIERLPIRSAFFRSVPEREPRGPITDRLEQARWLSTFDYVAGVYWLPGGRLLVAYQNIEPDHAMTRTWHLLELSRSAEPRVELRGVGRVLAVDSATGELLLVDRNAEVPNQWVVAQLPR